MGKVQGPILPRRAIWAVVGLGGAASVVSLALAGLSVGSWALEGVLAAFVGLAFMRLHYRPQGDRWQGAAFDLLEALTLFSAVSLFGGLASYAVAALTVGYADGLLAAADREVGFDWAALYRLTVQTPWLQTAGRLAYGSIYDVPILLLAGLSFGRQARHMRRFLLAYALALAATVVIFAWFPAKSPLAHLPAAAFSYMPLTGAQHVPTIEALRSGRLNVINVAWLYGIIGFPSFHAVSAVLFMWGGWSVRWLRWPGAAVNLAMLASTPIEGTHYLVDVVGGIAVAGLAILLVLGAERARLPKWLRRPLAIPAAVVAGGGS